MTQSPGQNPPLPHLGGVEETCKTELRDVSVVGSAILTRAPQARQSSLFSSRALEQREHWHSSGDHFHPPTPPHVPVAMAGWVGGRQGDQNAVSGLQKIAPLLLSSSGQSQTQTQHTRACRLRAHLHCPGWGRGTGRMFWRSCIHSCQQKGLRMESPGGGGGVGLPAPRVRMP